MEKREPEGRNWSVAAALAAWALLAPAGARAGQAEMTERPGLVTIKGLPMTLIGRPVKVGERAPDFTVLDNEWNKVRLSDFQGKILLISVVASLETPGCTIQTRRFSEEAARLPPSVQVLTISEDLPYTQKRFCQTEKLGSVKVLSDVVAREFGLRYGLLIKERSLLARSIVVIGKDGIVRYVEIVPEMTQQPDYAKALAAVRKLAP